MLAAWREFKRGKTKKAEVQAFNFNLEDNLFALHEQLANKTYRPDPYAFFYVRDPKLRPIHKAAVKDRVVFQAVFRILYDIFDRKFIHDSYSCRFKKGTHRGVERLTRFFAKASRHNQRPVFVLKCDVRQFFYSIDHAVLFGLIQQSVIDAEALDLISKIIDSFQIQPGKGLPLGNVTSQLFANVYLNELDQYVKHILKEQFYLRYCDDFVIMGLDQNQLVSLVPRLNNFLQNHLLVSLHPQKIKIRKLSQGVDWLGYVLLPHFSVLRTSTKKRMFKKMRRKTEEYNIEARDEQSLGQTLQSYLGVLSHCCGYKLEQELKKVANLE